MSTQRRSLYPLHWTQRLRILLWRQVHICTRLWSLWFINAAGPPAPLQQWRWWQWSKGRTSVLVILFTLGVSVFVGPFIVAFALDVAGIFVVRLIDGRGGVGSFVVVFGGSVSVFVVLVSMFVVWLVRNSFMPVSVVLAFALASVVPPCHASGWAGVRCATVCVAVTLLSVVLPSFVLLSVVLPFALPSFVQAFVLPFALPLCWCLSCWHPLYWRYRWCLCSVRGAGDCAGICPASVCAGIHRAGICAGDCRMLAFVLASVPLAFALASIVLVFASLLLAVRVHITISITIKYRVSN